MPAKVRERVERAYWGECDQCDEESRGINLVDMKDWLAWYTPRGGALEREYPDPARAQAVVAEHNAKFHAAAQAQGTDAP